jgi:predicted ATPase
MRPFESGDAVSSSQPHERTEGNPFFLEESVRTLLEQEMLDGAPGAYRVTRPLAALQIPATAQAIIAARIDRLAPVDKRLLQAASVIGKDVPPALLEAIGEMPERALRESLARLQVAEFLYETSLFPEAEYTFKHALTHEVTYGSLLQERRRGLHARIVETIESLYGLDDPTSEAIARSHLGQAQFESGACEEAAANAKRSIAALRVEAGRTRLGYGSFPFGALQTIPGALYG